MLGCLSTDIRDLKILDAAAFKNAVTSERAWVMTAAPPLRGKYEP